MRKRKSKIVYKEIHYSNTVSFHGLFETASSEAKEIALKYKMNVKSLSLNNFMFDEKENGQFLFKITLE